jgi:hypothetical protein
VFQPAGGGETPLLRERGVHRCENLSRREALSCHGCLPHSGMTWRDAMKSALKLKAEKTAKRPAPKRQPQKRQPRQSTLLAVDALLDEALSETFPASDPVALTQPSRRRRAALKKNARQ